MLILILHEHLQMKINLILSTSNETSKVDANILCFLFKKVKHNIEPKFVNIDSFKCDNASINIFIGLVNPLLIPYSKTNVLLFDEELFPKSNLFTLKNIDFIFTKTRDIIGYLSNSLVNDKIRYIGWRSSDLNLRTISRDYTKYLLYCYSHSEYILYQRIINSWQNNIEVANNQNIKLHIVNFFMSKLDKSNIKAKNIIIEENLSQEKFENLFNSVGVHICLNQHHQFSHFLNQSMLCQSLVIVPNTPETKSVASDDYAFYVGGTSSKHKTLFGNKFNFDEFSFVKAVLDISRLKAETCENIGNKGRSDALRIQSESDSVFKNTMNEIIKLTHAKPKKTTYLTMKLANDEDLPSVSVVTLTKNRKKFFNLAIFNFNQINYPKSKLEWVVYDTSNSENRVDGLLPPKESRKKYNIKYIHSDNVETIGVSRNNAIKECNNDYIVFYDDDDYYYPDSVRNRIHPFMFDEKLNIVCCSAMASFEINKFYSFIDYPSLVSSPLKRYRVGSMAIKRELFGKKDSFWCEDTSINELGKIVAANVKYIQEISWENVIISLIHTQNTTWRQIPDYVVQGYNNPNNKIEPPFSIGSKMFKFLTELDKSDEILKEIEAAKKARVEEAQKQALSRLNPTSDSDSISEELKDIDNDVNNDS